MPTKNEILIYNSPGGASNVKVYLTEDDMWMTQVALSELFQTTKANITMHIQNIYKDGELLKNELVSLTYYFETKVQVQPKEQQNCIILKRLSH